MNRKIWLLLLLALVSSAVAIVVFTQQQAPQKFPSAPGSYELSLTVGARVRSYLLHIPPSYDGVSRVPLVLIFHGYGLGGTIQAIEGASNMTQKADQEGFIVVYPQGTGGTPSWNAGHCCGEALAQNVDDVGFVRALIIELEDNLRVDPKKVYAAGISNGGAMVHRLGAELSDQLAAIAVVSGVLGGKATTDSPLFIPPEPTHAVSVIIFHGMADQLVPYEGGHGVVATGDRIDLSVSDAVNFWVAADKCSMFAQIETSSGGQVVKEVHSGGDNGTEVVLYTIVNGGHAWPGATTADEPSRIVPATDLIWEFFAAHPKS